MRKVVVLVVAVAVLAGCGGGGGSGDPVARGEALYAGTATCATCHGSDLRGTTMGPPLPDPVYAAAHHPDEAFFAAVAVGVRPHHWDFGPMPPLPHLSRSEVEAIVAYVRSVQQRNGIS